MCIYMLHMDPQGTNRRMLKYACSWSLLLLHNTAMDPRGGGGGRCNPLFCKELRRLEAACTYHTVTIRSVVMYGTTGNKATQFVLVWSH